MLTEIGIRQWNKRIVRICQNCKGEIENIEFYVEYLFLLGPVNTYCRSQLFFLSFFKALQCLK